MDRPLTPQPVPPHFRVPSQVHPYPELTPSPLSLQVGQGSLGSGHHRTAPSRGSSTASIRATGLRAPGRVGGGSHSHPGTLIPDLRTSQRSSEKTTLEVREQRRAQRELSGGSDDPVHMKSAGRAGYTDRKTARTLTSTPSLPHPCRDPPTEWKIPQAWALCQADREQILELRLENKNENRKAKLRPQ